MANIQVVDRTEFVSGYGVFAVNTFKGFAQTFTALSAPLTQIEYYLDWVSGGGPIEYRTYVVTNDATGNDFSPGQVIGRSAVQSFAPDSGTGSILVPVKFDGVALTEGAQYAFIIDLTPTADQDDVSIYTGLSYASNAGSPGQNYEGGNVFFFNGAESAMFSDTWTARPQYDLGFRLTFGSNAAPVNSAPSGGLQMVEDTPGSLSGPSVSDADGDELTAVLTVTSGVITVDGPTEAFYEYLAPNSLRLTGSAGMINASFGELGYTPDPDFNGSATLTLVTSDGTLSDTDVIALNVAAMNDAPTLAVNTSNTAMREAITATGVVLTPGDVDAGTVFATNSFNLTGADADLFKVVNGPNGTFSLQFRSAPDFEAPRDSNSDNVYNLSVAVIDRIGGASSAARPLTISVTNVNEVVGPPGGGTVTGTAGVDILRSGGGYTVLRGLEQDDELYGADGVDSLNGGSGTDTMAGGLGNDIYYVDVAGDKVIEAAGQGTDTVYSSAPSYTLGTGVSVEVLRAADTASSTTQKLFGNEQAQALFGGNAMNYLFGRGGNDKLTGGLGNDLFCFDQAPSTSTNVDTITDFANAAGNDDRISLENAIFAKLTATGTLNGDFFAANETGAATDADDYIVYNTSNGKLFYDADGNTVNGVAAVQFATLSTFASLTGTAALSAADFIVY